MKFYLNQKGGGGGATHHDEVNIYFRQLNSLNRPQTILMAAGTQRLQAKSAAQRF